MTRELMFRIHKALDDNEELKLELEKEIAHGHVTVGDRIWWSLTLVRDVKEEGGENIELVVEKIETSLDGSKIIWMKRAFDSRVN